jgi:hypothetical protein
MGRQVGGDGFKCFCLCVCMCMYLYMYNSMDL